MTDDQDPLLKRLFAEQDLPAHEPDFMPQFIILLERDRRNRRAFRIALIIAGVTIAALFAPWIAQVVAIAIGSVASSITAGHALLMFPMAWLAACSVAASFLPVIYLGITRRW